MSPKNNGVVRSRCGVFVAAVMVSANAMAFTQGAGVLGSGGTPQGHEWLTVRSAHEVLGDAAGDAAGDPRNQPLPNGQPFPRAVNPYITSSQRSAFKQATVSETRYEARYSKVLAALLGQRWVDIGGFNVARSQTASYNCFDAVAQLPDDVQHDHYVRERGDEGGAGAVAAMEDSAQRFIQYFVAAAMAPEGTLRAWDGGGYSVAVTVDRPYFLAGRAMHLFQDSFSSDHSVRELDDGYKRVRGMKTYLCTRHSDQHSHTRPFSADLNLDYMSTGDIIWRSRQWDWTPANVKLNALAAVEGMKDVWASFIRVRDISAANRQAAAQAEAERIAQTWLSFDAAEVISRYDAPDAALTMASYVTDQEACDLTIGGKAGHDIMQEIAEARAICIYNIEATEGTTERDRQLHIPFMWGWKNNYFFLTPPEDFNPLAE